MKESKNLTYLMLFLSIVLSCCLYFIDMNSFWNGIVFNLLCGTIVAFVTTLAQYFIAKASIIDNIYSSYLTIYRNIYMVEKDYFLFTYNVSKIYNIIQKETEKITDNINLYSAFFPRCIDFKFKKINPDIYYKDSKIKKLNIYRLFFPFNKSEYNKIIVPYKKLVVGILETIDKKKFKKDMLQYEQIMKSFGFIK